MRGLIAAYMNRQPKYISSSVDRKGKIVREGDYLLDGEYLWLVCRILDTKNGPMAECRKGTTKLRWEKEMWVCRIVNTTKYYYSDFHIPSLFKIDKHIVEQMTNNGCRFHLS